MPLNQSLQAGNPIVNPDGTMAYHFRDFMRNVDTAIDGGSLTAVWGSISGTLANQTDLQAALDATRDASNITEGQFNDAQISESSVTQHQAALEISESQIPDLDRIRWRNEFVQGQEYMVNDMAWQGDRVGVANADTFDPLEPVEVGGLVYVYTGTIGSFTVSAKQLMFGTRYTVATDEGRLEGYRINVVAGNQYSVVLVRDPLGTPIYEQLLTSITPAVTGWMEFSVEPVELSPGVTFDLVAVANEPDPTVTQTTLNYNYATPNNYQPPINGQAVQANRQLNILGISTTDADGGDATATLSDLAVGDRIAAGGITWAVQSVAALAGYYEIGISPQTQITPGAHAFVFEIVTPSPITVPRDADTNYWDTVGLSNLAGLYFEDTAYDPATTNRSAYGVDLMVQQISRSPDWDLLPR